MHDLKLQSKVDSTITYYNIECFCVFMVRRKVEDGGVFGFYSSWGKGNFDMNTNSAQWTQKCQKLYSNFFGFSKTSKAFYSIYQRQALVAERGKAPNFSRTFFIGRNLPYVYYLL